MIWNGLIILAGLGYPSDLGKKTWITWGSPILGNYISWWLLYYVANVLGLYGIMVTHRGETYQPTSTHSDRIEVLLNALNEQCSKPGLVGDFFRNGNTQYTAGDYMGFLRRGRSTSTINFGSSLFQTYQFCNVGNALINHITCKS